MTVVEEIAIMRERLANHNFILAVNSCRSCKHCFEAAPGFYYCVHSEIRTSNDNGYPVLPFSVCDLWEHRTPEQIEQDRKRFDEEEE